MNFLKIITGIIFVVLTITLTTLTNYNQTNETIDISKYPKITKIVVDVENTDLQLSSSNTTQILIEEEIPKIEKNNVEYNVNIDQDVLKITRPIDENKVLDFQSKLKIVIPNTVKLSNVDIISKNSDIAIGFINSENFNFSGTKSNVKLDGVNSKNGIVKYDMMNFNLRNSVFENFDLEVDSGSLQLVNSRINKMLTTKIKHGSTDFNSSFVLDSKIEGDQVLYLTLSELYNAEVHTTRKIKNNKLTPTDYGFEYQALEKTNETMKINAGNLKIK